jgi:4-hydroxy-2-oxoheptanedioate aldolase
VSFRFFCLLALAGVCWAPLQAQSNKATALVEALRQGKIAFGSMVPDRTEAGGAKMAQDANLDFVFYDMERNYDIPALKIFMKGLRSAANKTLLVRIPPIGTEPDKAEARVAELLDVGADGIVFPHIENKRQAELAVQWLGRSSRGLYPQKADGQIVGYLMIEDRDAVDHAKEIVGTKGATMFAPGQSSLGQAYGRNEKAVESAIQTILSACKEMKANCAKLASDTDIEQRIKEGFRVLMAPSDVIARGRKLAGRQ